MQNRQHMAENAQLYIAEFQITVFFWYALVRWGKARFGHDFINCFASDLLLCPFNKELIIWEKMCLGFWQTGYPRFSFMMYCYSTDLPVHTWREFTSRNRQVFWIQFLRNPYHHKKRGITAKEGLSSETPYRKWYQPNWRCNIHRQLQTRQKYLCVEVDLYMVHMPHTLFTKQKALYNKRLYVFLLQPNVW